MLNVLPNIFVLGLAALAALLLVLSRRSPPEKVAERLAAVRALALAVGVQSIHFPEEEATSLHERLGPSSACQHSALRFRHLQPVVARDPLPPGDSRRSDPN